MDDHHTPLPSIVAQPFPKPARQTSLFPYRKSIRGSPTVPRLLGDPIELDVMEGDSVLAGSCPHSMQLCHEGKRAVFEATGSESLFLKKPQIFSWRSSLQLGFPNLLTCDACRGSNHYLCAPGISFLGYSQQYSPPCKCNHVISLKSDRSEEQLPEESSSSLGKVEVSLQDAPSHLFSKTRPRILNNSGPNSSSSWSD